MSYDCISNEIKDGYLLQKALKMHCQMIRFLIELTSAEYINRGNSAAVKNVHLA